MFGNKKGPGQGSTSERFDTIIANNTSISGDITAEGNVRIDGSYTGDITSSSEVIIGDNGLVNGNIKAQTISVSGKIDGNVECEGLLEIFSHGVVDGNIDVKSLSIVEGGIFSGKCQMGRVKSNMETNMIQENDSFEIIEE